MIDKPDDDIPGKFYSQFGYSNHIRSKGRPTNTLISVLGIWIKPAWKIQQAQPEELAR